MLLTLTCVAGMLLAPMLATLYAAGFRDDPERMALVESLTRWLFPFLGLAGMAALAAGALQVRGRFGAPAFAPALLNVAMIAAPFLLLPLATRLDMPPISTLAFGAVLGGAAMLLVQLPLLHRLGMLQRPRIDFRDPEVRRSLSLMAPLVVGLGVYQFNILLSRLFASFMPEGSQSYLSYGQRVVEIPQGMFGNSDPAHTRASEERAEGGRAACPVSQFPRLTLFIALPASVMLLCLAEPVIAVLFGRGAFGPAHVAQTANSLAFQAMGVWAVASVRATIPVFAAHQDTRTPVKASALNLLVFLSLTLLLMGSLNHVAIAIANSAAAALQLGVLLFALRQKLGALGLTEVASSALRTLLASAAMAVSCSLLAAQLSWSGTSELPRIGALAGIMLVGGLTFLAAAWLLKARELTDLADAVRRRGKRAT